MKKRSLTAFLVVILIISLTGCGSKESDIPREFKSQNLEINIGEEITDNDIHEIGVIEDKIYMTTYSFRGSEYDAYLITLDLQGKLLTKHTLIEAAKPPFPDKDGSMEAHNAYPQLLLADGRLVYIDAYSAVNKKENISTDVYQLVVCDKDGTESLRVKLSEVLPDEKNTYIESIVPSGENTLFLIREDMVVEMDMTGKVAAKYERAEVTRTLYSVEFFKDKQPVAAARFQAWKEPTYGVVDLRKGELTEELTLPAGFEEYDVFNGMNSGYDLLLSNDTGIYGYHFKSEENMLHVIMEDTNSDVEFPRIEELIAVNEECFIALYSEEADDSERQDSKVSLIKIMLK